MSNKKAIIICASIHHNNTMKVAEAISEVLEAQIVRPSDVDIEALSCYDIIGFGSGIYNQKHHRSLLDLVSKLKAQKQKNAFIFSTACVRIKTPHRNLRASLIDKGFNIIGEFQCRGLMTYSFTKYLFGGLNKGRPNDKDLKGAQDFAKKICEEISIT